MAKIKFLFSLAVLLCCGTSYAKESETTVTFRGSSSPIIQQLSPGEIGTVIFETALSDAPSTDYDAVLLDGEMPDQNVKLALLVKNNGIPLTEYTKYEPVRFKRFSNGRFWAKFKLSGLTRQPFKLSIIDMGVKTTHIFTIYNIETSRNVWLKEVSEPVQEPAQISTQTPVNFPFKLITRAEWQALPATEPYTAHTPALFTLHHTQGHLPKNIQESMQEILFIQDFHQNGRGWIDIGYHFLIDPFGNIFEGRPIGVLGAHVKGHNTGNVGISLMGNYHPPVSNQPSPEIIAAFVTIGKYLQSAYGVTAPKFYAHRDLGATDCPGDVLYARMPELKDLIFKAEVPVISMRMDPSFAQVPGAQLHAFNQLLESPGR